MDGSAIRKYIAKRGGFNPSPFYTLQPDGSLVRTVVETPIPIRKAKPVKKLMLDENEPTYLIRVSRIY